MFVHCFLEGIEKPLSVVIVGGGPAGLATAIEACDKGMHTVVIEKRSSYTRSQLVFLFNPTLELLEKWEVVAPSMKVVKLRENQRVGLIKLSDLETALACRVAELPIDRIEGRFTEVHSSWIEVAAGNEQIEIPYDILVGADGMHSHVREIMEVPCISMGSSTATVAFIPFEGPSKTAEMPATQPYQGYFMRSLLIPFGRIIMIQDAFGGLEEAKEFVDPKRFEEIALAFGWEKEANLIRSGNCEIIGPLTVALQQSAWFSDSLKSIILVGDAAAVAPFLQGRGANYCFQAANMAGHFFTKVQQDKATAYKEFDCGMQRATEDLIEDCRYLIRQLQ